MIRDTAIARTIDSTELEWMTRFIPAEPWMRAGACAQVDPDIFFLDKGRSDALAKEACEGCDVREQCLAYALKNREEHGIWGGTTARERKKILKAARA